MPSLQTTVDGIVFPNPFVIGSGPPGTNAKVINRAFKEGWGGVVAKTVSLDASKVINVAPRYGKLTGKNPKEVFGWENIELIATTSFEDWLDDFKKIKDAYPDRPLIASIMEEHNADAWAEVVGRCEETGVDAFELNFSCPHGLPERKMGAAMGEEPDLVEEVTGWVMKAATVPVWAKMTPNVTHIEDPSRAALRAGAHGLSLINTIRSVIGVDLDTLRPMPTVEGYSTPGGYSSVAVRPIALRMVMETSRLIREEFEGGRTVSGMGGVETGDDAAQFLLLGADTVQVCTGVMKMGYGMVKPMIDELEAFMAKHSFETIEEFRGHALPYFTTHADLVQRQAAARAEKRAAVAAKAEEKAAAKAGITRDENWDGDDFVKQSDDLVSGRVSDNEETS